MEGFTPTIHKIKLSLLNEIDNLKINQEYR